MKIYRTTNVGRSIYGDTYFTFSKYDTVNDAINMKIIYSTTYDKRIKNYVWIRDDARDFLEEVPLEEIPTYIKTEILKNI